MRKGIERRIKLAASESEVVSTIQRRRDKETKERERKRGTGCTKQKRNEPAAERGRAASRTRLIVPAKGETAEK